MAIDVFSKYAFARLLKQKKATPVLNAYKDILKEAKTKPKTLFVDLG